MARFRCRACGEEGEFDPSEHKCPTCGSLDVQFTLSIAELQDDDPLIEMMRQLAQGDEE